MASVGLDYLTKEEQINDKIVKIKLWDSAGQEQFHTLTNNYIRKGDGIIIVFDITNKDTFQHIENWRQEFLEQLNPPDAKDFPFILLTEIFFRFNIFIISFI